MKNLLSIFCLLGMLTACNSNNNNNSTATGTSTETTTTEVASPDKEMGLKSVMYETETEMPAGMNYGSNKTTIYSDDYGKKSRTTSVMHMSYGGKSIDNTSNSLRLGDDIYSWSSAAKGGMRFKIDKDKFDPNSTDLTSLTEDMKKRINYKEEGTETIQGKECKVASFSSDNMSGKIWTWKGVPMQMQMTVMGKTVTTKVISIQENPSFPASTFDVPAGIEFKEMNAAATAQK
ncbi:MAG: hypothetical protein R2739_03060 [Chitinophagales bacterium]